MLGLKLNHVSKRGHWSGPAYDILSLNTGVCFTNRDLLNEHLDYIPIKQRDLFWYDPYTHIVVF